MLLQRSLDYMSFFLLLVSQCTSSKVKLCLFLQHSRTHYTCIHTWMHTSLFYLSFSLLTKWVAIYLHDSWASDLSSSLHYTGHTALCKAKYLLSRIWFIINFPISEVFPSSIELEVVWKIMKYFTTLRQSIEIKKEIILTSLWWQFTTTWPPQDSAGLERLLETDWLWAFCSFSSKNLSFVC